MSSSHEVCPDPSAHEGTHAARLQDQASKAALRVTGHGDKGTERSSREIEALGPDGKLSAAGAAASLKFAQPRDLPSFPSVGIDTSTSGNKAANLANANQKPFEHWKPELSASASKAALLANKKGDFADGLWQPSASANGQSAAGAAMKGAHSVDLDYGYTEDGRRKALLAATLSIKKKNDAPAPKPELAKYPDAKNSAFNALNAATVAHRPLISDPLEGRLSDEANEMSRITHLQNVPREMFSEHPPLKIESDEQKRQDALRAATISNKQKVEETRRQLVEQQAAQAAAHSNIREQAKNYLTLQSEAQKLANERLAKLDPDGATAFREHYGYGASQAQAPKHKLSMRSRRSNSDTKADDDEDTRQAGRIRHQTRNLREQVQSLDDKKKQEDRANLQAAAERLVKARLSQMDDRVFMETGKASPAMMEEWEKQARIKANANVEERMKHYGKVHIGGGKYMDQSEIDAIAAGRMQPTLDEITDTAEKQRARDEEIRLDQERRKLEHAAEQAREKEKKDAVRRQKDEDKAAKQAEKDAEKARKQEEKELAAIHKRLEKEEEKQFKDKQKEQDKEWVKEQQSAEAERVAKAEAAEAEAAEAEAAEAAKDDEPSQSAAPVPATAPTVDYEPETEPVIKDMTTGEPKEVSTLDQAPIAGLLGSTKKYFGHKGPGEGTSKKESEKEEIADATSPATNYAQASESTQDPPGVPTTFPDGKQPDDLVTTGRPQTDAAGVSTAEASTTSTTKAEKRKSGIKGVFSKLKRNSRQSDETSNPKVSASGAAAPARSRSPSLSSLSSDEAGGERAALPTFSSGGKPSHRRNKLSSVFSSSGSRKEAASHAAASSAATESRGRAPATTAAAATEDTAAAGSDARASASAGNHSPVPGSRFQEEL